MSSDLATVVPLLSSVRDGATSFHAVLFTRADSGLTRVQDLSAARAAWVAPTSASGYLVPRLALVRRGVSLDEAFDDEVFLDSHGAVARAVLSGDADVGATYAHFEDGDPERRLVSSGYLAEDPNADVPILAVGGPIPADMIVAHPDVSLHDRIAFAAGLSRLANCAVGSEPIRRVIGADGFQAVSHESLAELEALMQASHVL
jgi:phosphonate transport system substrate-binding protein